MNGLHGNNFSTLEDVKAIHEKYDIDAIIFPTQRSASGERERLIVYGMEVGMKFFITPPMDEYGKSRDAERTVIREVKIEDLLGREEIKINMEVIKENFAGKVVMVTGAAGSIGSELCRQLATFGIKQLVMFDNAETPMHNVRLEFEERFSDLKFVPVIGDVRQPQRLDFAFRKYRPQVVFHAAAYKHVPLMEENPCEAVLVNVYGSRNVADFCLKYDVEKMVMVSTDKAVNPTNIMGCTKRLAEIYVQSLGLSMEQGKTPGKTKFVTTRFGNVLGSNGSVIPRFREQIAKGGPITVTHPEITRFFMTIPEACRLVMEAATMTDGNQIFVFDMGASVKIADLAKRMIKLAGLVEGKDINIEYTGLRPGEKLYEEVLSNAENTIPTDHKRIHIAKVREYNYEDACAAVEKLENYSRIVEIPEMVKLMKQVVPEFISKNSIYEQYDKK
jgi:FlaA1/EpsC-like NDP-sugar epimerase